MTDADEPYREPTGGSYTLENGQLTKTAETKEQSGETHQVSIDPTERKSTRGGRRAAAGLTSADNTEKDK